MFAGIVYPNPFENDPILFSPCCAPVLCGLGCGTSGHPAGYFRRGKAGHHCFRPDCLPARGRASPVPGGRRARFPGLGAPAPAFRRGDVPRRGRCAPGRVVRCRQAGGGRGAGSGQFDGRTLRGRSPACARFSPAVDARPPGESCGAHETGNARQYSVGGAYGRGFARGGAVGWNSVGGGCGRGNGTDAAISGRGSAKFPQMGDGEPEISPGGARG